MWHSFLLIRKWHIITRAANQVYCNFYTQFAFQATFTCMRSNAFHWQTLDGARPKCVRQRSYRVLIGHAFVHFAKTTLHGISSLKMPRKMPASSPFGTECEHCVTVPSVEAMNRSSFTAIKTQDKKTRSRPEVRFQKKGAIAKTFIELSS